MRVKIENKTDFERPRRKKRVADSPPLIFILIFLVENTVPYSSFSSSAIFSLVYPIPYSIVQ